MRQERERAIQYRARAEELLRQCERQADQRRRAVLLDLAGTYHRIANQIEEAERLHVEANKKAKGG